MKRIGHIHEKIVAESNCIKAILNASQGKRYRWKVKEVLSHIEVYAKDLSQRLQIHEFATPYKIRKITDGLSGKERELQIPAFYPDQCAHHAIVQILRPIVEKSSYYWSCANIPRRGIDRACRGVERATVWDLKHAKYCVKLDIQRFKKYGKTMDDVRNDVAALLGQTAAPVAPSTKPAAETLYRVQVGAYKQKPNADAMLAKLKAASFEGFTTKVGELYKVQVGAYKDSVKAENFRQTVKQAGFPAMVVKTSTGPQGGPQEGFKPPYRVQVHTPVLNVRQGPSTGAVRVGSVRQGEVLTIAEESTGQGATLWGKVENKNGWISLDFVKKV